MKYIGIDPGTKTLGYAVMEDEKILESGEIDFLNRQPSLVLLQLKYEVEQLLMAYTPTTIVCEKMFVRNKNAALLSTLPDEIEYIARDNKINFISYAPTTVKYFIIDGKASKKQVKAVLCNIYPELKKSGSDETDAVAIALCGYYNSFEKRTSVDKTFKQLNDD